MRFIDSLLQFPSQRSSLSLASNRDCPNVDYTLFAVLAVLQSLNVTGCHQLTDASLQALAQHCGGLQFLNVAGCPQLTNASVQAIAQRCSMPLI